MKQKLLGLLCCLLLVQGCTLKWWYNYADWILLRSVDHYFDLTSEQKDLLEPLIQQHLQWYRTETLPLHIQYLEEIQNRFRRPSTPEDIDWLVESSQTYISALSEHMVKDAAQLASTLNAEQINNFAEELKEDNEPFAERLALSTEEQLQIRAKRTLEFLEQWVGALSKAQEQEVLRLSLALPHTFPEWYQRRVERQQTFLQMLREKKSADELAQTLRDWFVHRPLIAPHEHYAQIRDMLLAVDRLLTPVQREHGAQELQKLIDDLKKIERG